MYNEREIEAMEKKARKLREKNKKLKKSKKKDPMSDLIAGGGFGLAGLLINSLRK